MQAHPNKAVEKGFILSIAITIVVLLAEVIGGLWTGSLALLSDSAHVFMDIFALGLSYLALRLSSLPPDDRHTYGYHRLEVLAALANGATLAVISIGIFVEAYHRWFQPQTVDSRDMLWIAGIGLAANLFVAFVLGGVGDPHHPHADGEPAHTHRDLNLESAFIHVIGDAISSVGVIVAAILIGQTGWLWLDPLMSVIIGLIILVSSVRVLRSSLHILIEGTPEGISIAGVERSLAAIPGVLEVHDLHIWNICSGTMALSAHLVLNEAAHQNSISALAEVKKVLASSYGIEHSTVQLEGVACGQGESLRDRSNTNLS